jgi:hypothetical protein
LVHNLNGIGNDSIGNHWVCICVDDRPHQRCRRIVRSTRAAKQTNHAQEQPKHTMEHVCARTPHHTPDEQRKDEGQQRA